MDYHEFTLARYMDKVEEEERMTDAIVHVLEDIEQAFPNVLPDDEDICFNIGLDIVENEYDPVDYMEDWIEKHNTNEEK
jgi:hypothetical protein